MEDLSLRDRADASMWKQKLTVRPRPARRLI